jgi:hypothetical protein
MVISKLDAHTAEIVDFLRVQKLIVDCPVDIKFLIEHVSLTMDREVAHVAMEMSSTPGQFVRVWRKEDGRLAYKVVHSWEVKNDCS